MRFERDDKKCSFEIPDRPTVKQQLIYMGKASGVNDGYPLRFWNAAKDLIKDWKCDIFQDYNTDLDTIDNPNITDILVWAGLQVWTHMVGLEELPKN
jgi:hypothetical protein